LSYSLQNIPFSNNVKIEILNAQHLDIKDLNIVISDKNGNSMQLVKSDQGNIFSDGSFGFELGNSFPNPFNPTTEINFSLPVDGQIQLNAYNIQGQQVADIFNGFQSKGHHQFTWDASELTSGIYFVKLTAGNHQATTQTVLMK